MRNAMVVHAACGGSSNLIIHLSAIAYHAGLKRPAVDDWDKINRLVPRLVDCYPMDRKDIPPLNFSCRRRTRTDAQVKELDLLELNALTCTGKSLEKILMHGKGAREESDFTRS